MSEHVRWQSDPEPFPVRSDGQLNKMLADCFHMCLMHNVAEDNSLHEALLEGKRVLLPG